jgi:hypothetical protein
MGVAGGLIGELTVRPSVPDRTIAAVLNTLHLPRATIGVRRAGAAPNVESTGFANPGDALEGRGADVIIITGTVINARHLTKERRATNPRIAEEAKDTL